MRHPDPPEALYLVTSGPCGEYVLEGIFYTREAAERFRDSGNHWTWTPELPANAFRKEWIFIHRTEKRRHL